MATKAIEDAIISRAVDTFNFVTKEKINHHPSLKSAASHYKVKQSVVQSSCKSNGPYSTVKKPLGTKTSVHTFRIYFKYSD